MGVFTITQHLGKVRGQLVGVGPSTMLVLEREFRWSGCVAVAFIQWAILLLLKHRFEHKSLEAGMSLILPVTSHSKGSL